MALCVLPQWQQEMSRNLCKNHIFWVIFEIPSWPHGWPSALVSVSLNLYLYSRGCIGVLKMTPGLWGVEGSLGYFDHIQEGFPHTTRPLASRKSLQSRFTPAGRKSDTRDSQLSRMTPRRKIVAKSPTTVDGEKEIPKEPRLGWPWHFCCCFFFLPVTFWGACPSGAGFFSINRSWWLNQPIWKICASQIGSISPGVNMKNFWNHHLDKQNSSFSSSWYWIIGFFEQTHSICNPKIFEKKTFWKLNYSLLPPEVQTFFFPKKSPPLSTPSPQLLHWVV